jgi:hypothetical protein
VLLLTVCVGLIAADAKGGLLRLRKPKGRANDVVLFEAWNPISRVAVYDRPHRAWSLGPRFRGKEAPSLTIDIDAQASTPLVSADREAHGYLRYDLTAAVHAVAPKGRALVIGPGGGRDVLTALLSGAKEVEAAEINGIIADQVMRGRYADYSGRL